MKHSKRFLVIAAISTTLSAPLWSGAALAAPAAAQTWSGAADGGLSRAEVLADLAMWRRAGLSVSGESYMNEWDPNYQQRLTLYQRLRNGPEYQAELKRLGGPANADEGK